MSETQEAGRTFLRSAAGLPFCEGCGHHHCLTHLDRALVGLDLEPSHVVIVSDVGCLGVAQELFSEPHTVQTPHGRSTAIATGIDLADSILRDSKLKTIVVVGDGGAVGGLSHLVNAAWLNVDVTVLVANNFLLGGSGGQRSSLSPKRFAGTAAGPASVVPPLDLCAIIQACGGEFVARLLATDANLPDTIAKAIQHAGFALVEIVEICTEWTNATSLDERVLADLLEGEHQRVGCLVESRRRLPFGSAYRAQTASGATAEPKEEEDLVRASHEAPLQGTTRWVVAGSVSDGVLWGTSMLMRAAVMSGLHATQRMECATPQGTGFSLAEICMSREEICYTGVDSPDVVVITSDDGLDRLRVSGILSRLRETSVVFADELVVRFDCAAPTFRAPFRLLCRAGASALGAILVAVARLQPIREQAVFDAIHQTSGVDTTPYGEELRQALAALRG
jgi:2-oxoglutarate ferredoxin oxidoreductase subunit beta